MATGTNPAYYQQHYTLIPVCCCCPLGSIIPSYSARCRVASVVLSFSLRSLERHLKCVCDTRHLQHPTFPPGPLLDIKNASKLRINLWVCVNCFSQCLFFLISASRSWLWENTPCIILLLLCWEKGTDCVPLTFTLCMCECERVSVCVLLCDFMISLCASLNKLVLPLK